MGWGSANIRLQGPCLVPVLKEPTPKPKTYPPNPSLKGNGTPITLL